MTHNTWREWKKRFDAGEVTLDEYIHYLENQVAKNDRGYSIMSNDRSLNFELDSAAMSLGLMAIFAGIVAIFEIFGGESTQYLTVFLLPICGGAWWIRNNIKKQVERIEERGL